MKTWHRVVIWVTALGGIPAFVTAAVLIGNSASVVVHARDYIQAIPEMQHKLSDHETRLKIQEDRWQIVCDWMRRHDE